MSDTTNYVGREELEARNRGTSARRGRRTKPADDCCTPECCCTQCSMRTLTRPRYYAGQLLTDADLADEQAYQIAKDRLHNRYLHGFGVVCGLEIACDSCDPRSVTIKPGYAIGPCGEDILVPCAETLDVIAAIDACRRRPTDCDPVERRPHDIDKAEEHWCITLAYDEQQVTPRAALRPGAKASCGCSEGRGCGGTDCGCGEGSGHGSAGCGCGHDARGNGHNGNGNNGNGHGHKGSCSCGGSCTCGAVPSRVYEPGKGLACEPTRVRETYRLGVTDRACTACDTSLAESELYRAGREVSSAGAYLLGSLGTANLLAMAIYALVPYDSLPQAYLDPFQTSSTLLSGKRALWDLYTGNPLGIPCPDLATVKAVEVVEVPAGGDAGQEWYQRQQQASLDILTLGLRYLWEYVCSKLQPPCPADPCDDRLVIGCVTVREGKVVKVCNFSCRKRAGSFTARDYWLSLTGIKPLVLWLIERLCCGDLISARSPIRNRLAELLEVVDPTGGLRAAVAKDDFRRVRRVSRDLARLRERIDVARVAEAARAVLAPPEQADFVAHLDRPVADVERDLDRAGVRHEVADVEHAPPLAAVRAAAAGGADGVTLLRDAATGRLAGVRRAEPERVEALSAEVRALRAELAELREHGAAGKPSAARKRTPKKATPKKATGKKATRRKGGSS